MVSLPVLQAQRPGQPPAGPSRQVSADEARAEPPLLAGGLLRAIDGAFGRLDALVAKALPEELNPLAQTGAIANTTFFVAVASGVAGLLVRYSSSVHLAYDSVRAMDAMRLGSGLLRSVHRYSSDGCMAFVLLHAAKLFFAGRFAGSRWLAWVTGIAPPFPALVRRLARVLAGVGRAGTAGRARHGAAPRRTPPVLGATVARVPDRRRRQLAVVLRRVLHAHAHPAGHGHRAVAPHHPPVALAVPDPDADDAVGARVAARRLARPARRHVRARADGDGPGAVHDGLAVPAPDDAHGSPRRRAPVGIPLHLRDRALRRPVDGDPQARRHRDGRGLSLQRLHAVPRRLPVRRHPHGAPATVAVSTVQSQVNPDKCVGCGICAGSCDSAGIDLPWLPALDVRKALDTAVDARVRAEDAPHVAFVCADSAGARVRVDPATGLSSDLPGYLVFPVPCAGWVQARLIERVLRHGARSVLIVACGPGSCTYREGGEWTRARAAGTRPPSPRLPSASGAVRVVELFRHQQAELKRVAEEARAGSPTATKAPSRWLRIAAGLAFAAAATLATWRANSLPYALPGGDASDLVVTFKHPGVVAEHCRKATEAELAKQPIHMRRPEIRERRRLPVRLRVDVDGQVALSKEYAPSGLWGDGSSLAMERVHARPGVHRVRVRLGDDADPEAWRADEERELQLRRAREPRRDLRPRVRPALVLTHARAHASGPESRDPLRAPTAAGASFGQFPQKIPWGGKALTTTNADFRQGRRARPTT